MLLYELETGNDHYPGRFDSFLNIGSTTLVMFTASVGLKNKKPRMSLQMQAEKSNQDNSTRVPILSDANFTRPLFYCCEDFAQRNEIYLISISQTSSESANVVGEFFILLFFSVFVIVKIYMNISTLNIW